MKKGKEWAKKEQRGSMRWERDGVCLALQWKDNRPVTMLKSIDNVNDYVHTDRNEKVCNVWQRVRIRQPKAVHHYNQYMNAVDRSDQILAKRQCTEKVHAMVENFVLSHD